MATIKMRDRTTGEEFQFEWNESYDPRDEDIDRLREVNAVSPLTAAVIGGVSGLDKVATGFRTAFATDEGAGKIREDYRTRQRSLRDLLATSKTARAARVAGEAAPFLALPGGAAPRLGTRLLASAVGGALAGGVSQPEENESRGENAFYGGVGGLLGQGAVSTAGKVVNAFKGPAKSSIRKLSEKWNVPVTLGEEMGPKTLTGRAALGVEVKAERIPSWAGGIGGKYRINQEKATSEAVERFLGEYVADPTVGASGNRNFVGGLYKTFSSEAAKAPSQEVVPNQTKNAASDLLKRYPDIFKTLQDTKMEEMLGDIVSGTKRVKTSPILGSTGNPIVSSKPPVISEMWELRKGLGDKIDQARRAGGVDRTAISQLKNLFSSVTADMEKWAEQTNVPELFDKFTQANDAYKKYVVKADIVQRAYEKAAKDLQQGGLFSPKKFANALTDTLQKDRLGGANLFSARDVEHISGLATILNAAKRGMQSMENVTAATGNRWGPAMTGATIGSTLGSVGGIKAVVAGASGLASLGWLARFLTTTRAGKNLVQAASKVEPNSLAMKFIVNQAYKAIPLMAAQAAQEKIP